ncbi:phthiocerol/phthiodiolone dimycocerosyl transferase family protein [Paraburkholderia sp. DHOC27]|uniref:phthiocerol/phthiodiolone dimycocerosyl transferase family protein n=1 Tax=Paraburkholderia sp. DHOC27 TaxID=2303330 RepID=UPI000E3EE261|nr:hypothetical protein [Paraburkholderia sp. DHOC27]RFU48370.1 hypothetical protein D0B32_00535 [Paraburkholderia sp. DHOC27]
MDTLNCQLTSGGPRYFTRRAYREATPTELTYIRTGTVVVSRSHIEGAVSRDEFDIAVAYLEDRYGILRAVVEDGQIVEREDDFSAVEAWLPAHTYSAEDVYATLLNAQLDTRVKVFSIYVLAADDGLDVFMLSSHAFTDATSLVELHACLAYLCDCIARGITPALEGQPFPHPVDPAVNRALAALPVDQRGARVSYSGAFARIPQRTALVGQPCRYRLERMVIEPADVQRISAAAHAHGSSVHSLLLAAFALAIGDMAQGEPRQILMRSSVDMRRRLEPHVSTELVFSAITGHITPVPDLDRPLFEIARHIFDEIHAGVSNGLVLQDYVKYSKTFGSPQQPPIALNVSDMQAVTFRWLTQQLKVTAFDYACGLRNFPNASISVYDGRLVANIAYAEELIDPDVMHTLSESVVAKLVSARAA